MPYRIHSLLVSGAVLSLLVCWPVVGQEPASPAPAGAIAPVAAPTASAALAHDGSSCDCAADPARGGRGARGACRSGYFRHNEFPHYPYFPCDHGYYYFQPYNVSHVALHQSIAAGWGIDARNPYSNEIFQKVYAQYEAEQSKGPAKDPGYMK